MKFSGNCKISNNSDILHLLGQHYHHNLYVNMDKTRHMILKKTIDWMPQTKNLIVTDFNYNYLSQKSTVTIVTYQRIKRRGKKNILTGCKSKLHIVICT